MKPPMQLAADRFARSIGRLPEDRLDRMMRGWRRRGILRQVFFGMPRQLNRKAAGDVRALVEYRVRGGRDGGGGRYQDTIADGRPRPRRGGEPPPRVTL